jgi:cation transport regulator
MYLPYSSNQDLPDSVRNHLPSDAQDIYREAYNFANKKYPNWEEGRKHQYAWGAVKKRFYENERGTWVKKS